MLCSTNQSSWWPEAGALSQIQGDIHPQKQPHHQYPLRAECSLLRVQALRQGHHLLKLRGSLLAQLLKLSHRNQGWVWVLGINFRGWPQCHPSSLVSVTLSGSGTLLKRLVNTALLYLFLANFSDIFICIWMLGALVLTPLILEYLRKTSLGARLICVLPKQQVSVKITRMAEKPKLEKLYRSNTEFICSSHLNLSTKIYSLPSMLSFRSLNFQSEPKRFIALLSRLIFIKSLKFIISSAHYKEEKLWFRETRLLVFRNKTV